MVQTSSVALIFTGVIKALDLWGNRPLYYTEPDAVFPVVSNAELIATAAILEVLLGLHLWLEGASKRSGLTLVWFCAVLAVYKLARYSTGVAYPCSCMGVLSRWLKLDWFALETLTWSLLGFLAVAGTYVFLSCRGRKGGGVFRSN